MFLGNYSNGLGAKDVSLFIIESSDGFKTVGDVLLLVADGVGQTGWGKQQ